MSPPPRVPPPPRRPLPPLVPHGGPDLAELASLGLRPDALLDFSVNCNPLGPSPRALRALDAVDPAPYPDSAALRLRGALAALHDVAPDEVIVGNGSVELIWLLAGVYLRAGDRVLVLGPTFGEYEAGARAAGADVVRVDAAEEDGFRLSLDVVAAALRRARPRLVFLCNPNNPTGQALGLDEIESILRLCGEALLVVDEAYVDFADGVDSAIALRSDPRLVILRSLTKNFGLAGLRLGYAIAARTIVEALGRARPPWTVNAFAQAAGLAAIGDEAHLREGKLLARRARAFTVDGLGRLGLRCLPSRANFWLVEASDASDLRRQLLPRGVLVRDCASFGLPTYVRLAARPLSDCQRLLHLLGSLVSSDHG